LNGDRFPKNSLWAYSSKGKTYWDLTLFEKRFLRRWRRHREKHGLRSINAAFKDDPPSAVGGINLQNPGT
jgi:hypothetical protein